MLDGAGELAQRILDARDARGIISGDIGLRGLTAAPTRRLLLLVLILLLALLAAVEQIVEKARRGPPGFYQ